jgi:molybdenum cofactor cytidylyltransferase
MNPTVVIVLAAGGSSRLGRPKQLVSLNGQTLLAQTLEKACALPQANVLVALGAYLSETGALAREFPVDVLPVPDWEKGMGHTLKESLRYALKAYPAMEQIMVLVCDQPYLTTQHLCNLAEGSQIAPGKIIASRYQHQVGVPALFPRLFFPALLEIDDATGARSMLRSHVHEVVTIPLEGGEVDIDTEEDFNQFLAQ